MFHLRNCSFIKVLDACWGLASDCFPMKPWFLVHCLIWQITIPLQGNHYHQLKISLRRKRRVKKEWINGVRWKRVQK